MNKLKEWLASATDDEIKSLVDLSGKSRAFLYQLSTDRRTPSSEIAGVLEEVTFEIRDRNFESRARLPKVYRGDLSPACMKCPYFKRGCYGESK